MHRIILGGIVTIVLFVAMTFLGAFYTIDAGQRGVIVRTGAVVGTADPGLGFKMPWLDTVVEIDTQSHAQLYEKVSVYSADQQPTELRLSVSFHIDPAKVGDLYTQYGSIDNIISRVLDRRVNEQVKNVFGTYTAVKAIQQRAKLNADAEQAIKAAIPHSPLVVESIQIENIDFSDAYEESIEARMTAEVAVQKLKQDAEREKVQAEITVTKAKAEADATEAQARAAANAIRAKGDAEAAAIKAKGAAEAEVVKAKGAVIAQNPGVIELSKIEKWNGTLPTSMIPGSTLPFINLNK